MSYSAQYRTCLTSLRADGGVAVTYDIGHPANDQSDLTTSNSDVNTSSVLMSARSFRRAPSIQGIPLIGLSSQVILQLVITCLQHVTEPSSVRE